MTVKTRNIWITGAGSGIGKALALALAEQGHTVIISGRDMAKLASLVEQFPQNIHPLVFDVADETGVDEARSTLKKIVDYLDCVILNAGICHFVKVNSMKVKTFSKVMNTNFLGFINTFNAALSLLQGAPERPHLVGIASMSSYVGMPRAQAYGASKAAAIYLLESIQADCDEWLDVTVVNPGFVKTPLTETNDFAMPFLVSSETAAAKIIAGLQSRPRRLQFPWQLHWILRLAQLVPSLWYRVAVPRLRRRG
jgi:short-subunit dehydrogenase